MKYLILFSFLLLISCGEQSSTHTANAQHSTAEVIEPIDPATTEKMYDECWQGKLGENIPVLVHYHKEAGFLIGTITYLNTANKTPIRLIGSLDQENNISLTEYANDGNITGMIYGQANEEQFMGTWSAPGSDKSYEVKLNRKDTLIHSSSIVVNPTKIPGSYHYQYGEDGYLGDVDVNLLENGLLKLELVSLTNAPARNIAEILVDSVNLIGTSFKYEIPDMDSCAFQINFYKNFLTVNYTKGGCYNGYFGHNASLEGLYVKVNN